MPKYSPALPFSGWGCTCFIADCGLCDAFQTVALNRDPTLKAYAPTWSVSNLATLPAEDIAPTARQIAVDLADRFVQAFQQANPK